MNIIKISLDGKLTDLTVSEEDWADLVEGRAANVEGRWVVIDTVDDSNQLELVEIEWSFDENDVLIVED